MTKTIRWLGLPLGALALGSITPPAYDLSGVWDYSIEEISEVGPCPSTGDFTGEAEIAQTAEAFTLDFTTGQACLPAGVCHFAGTVSGAHYHAANSVDVPGGGVTATTLDFDAASAIAATGSAVTTFTLGVDSCVWTYDFTITYAPEPATAGFAALVALGAMGLTRRRSPAAPPRPCACGRARR